VPRKATRGSWRPSSGALPMPCRAALYARVAGSQQQTYCWPATLLTSTWPLLPAACSLHSLCSTTRQERRKGSCELRRTQEALAVAEAQLIAALDQIATLQSRMMVRQGAGPCPLTDCPCVIPQAWLSSRSQILRDRPCYCRFDSSRLASHFHLPWLWCRACSPTKRPRSGV
jgi:hypothetical protein